MQPALATKGAIPKTSIFGDTNSGIFGSINRATGMSPTQPTSQPQQNQSYPQTTGNVTGMINQSTPPKPDTTYTHTTTSTSPTGSTTVTKPTSNKSVLAQQQSLNQTNKNTVGYFPLVEDGLAGPKTSAAIAQYGFNTQTGQPNTPKTSTSTTTPAVKPPTDYSASNPATFPGLINAGANASTNAANTGAENYNTANTGLINSLGQNQVLSDRAQEITRTAGQTMSDIGRKGAMGQAGYRTTGTSPVGEGNSAVLGQTTAAQQNAVAQGANMELQGTQQGLTAQGQTQSGFNQAGSMGLQGQGQGISGLGNIAGQIAPQLGNIGSQQYYNPLNQGQGGQGGTAMSQLPQQAQTAIQSYAQQVQNGSMTRGDAESRLSAYGIAGVNALNEVLGTGFNTNASNASAGTTAVGQQVSTFATSANAALDKLSTDFINLPDWQKMGIPGTIGIEQALGKFFGNDKLSTYQTTLHDARAQVSGVLATAGGMTPTSAGDTANAYLPDNMTKDQLAAKIAAVKTLIEQKVQAFQQSGAQNQTSGSGGTTSAGGYDFVQDANGNWKPK